MREPQISQHGRFKEILPFQLACGSHLDEWQREYSRSEDRRRAVGGKTSTAFSFAPDWTLPVTFRVLFCLLVIPPRTEYMPPRKPLLEAKTYRFDSCRRFRGSRRIMNGRLGAALDPEYHVVRTGYRIPERTKFCSAHASIPSNRRSVAASRCPLSHRPKFVQTGLGLEYHKRLCVKCGMNEVYLDIETLDWCEECIWKYVN